MPSTSFVLRGLAVATTMVAVFAVWELARHHGSASAASFTRRDSHALAASSTRSMSSEGARAAAQEECRRGYFYFDRRNAVASEAAFRHAIELNPESSSAHAGLSQALDSRALLLNDSPQGTADAAVQGAEEAARKAIALDPNNGRAFIALGTVQMNFTWQWREAEQNLSHGLQLSPDDAVGNMQYAMYLSGSGRTYEALDRIRRSVEADPLSFFMVRQQADVQYMGRRYAEALATLDRAREMGPQHPNVVDNWISWIDESKGLYDEAVEHDILHLRERSTPQELGQLQIAYRDGGWHGYWTARLDQLHPASQYGCGLYTVGTAYVRLGDRDHAFDALTRAAEQHCFWLNQIKVDPRLDGIRKDTRFPQLLSLVDPHGDLGPPS